MKARADMLALSPQIMDRIIAVFDRSQSNIRSVLTSQQQTKFDQIVAERKKMLEKIRQNTRKSP